MNNIVVISSIAGVMASLDPPIEYSTSKAALNHYIRLKAKEIAKTGICINAIAPGNLIYAKSRWQERLDENQEIVLRYIAENVPLNRFGQPKDVSNLIVQILENNTFMTGQVIAIDGGQTL
jgi:3-oxoacyl-[acyl-carrier protein] reductase